MYDDDERLPELSERGRKVLIGLLTFGLGFAVGWVARAMFLSLVG